jgi:hypothetical protein
MSALLDVDPVYSFPLCEQLALEALIMKGPPAERAFRQWIDCVDFDNIRFEATQIIPALFDRFASRNSNLPHFPRMKGLYRLSFARNATLMHAAWHSLVRLQEQGVEVMIFKGASLALKYYSGLPLRPMGDIDILVPAHQYDLANAILLKSGWKYRHSEETRRQVDHSTDYVNATGQGFDLHIRSLLEVHDAGFDNELFLRASSFDWRGASFLMPSPEDEVLIVIVNAMREWDLIKLLWVQDLALIIECNPTLEWSMLWKRAEAYGLEKMVFHGIHIATNVRGLELLYPILAEWIASSPDFEHDYLREAIANGLSYGLAKNRTRHFTGGGLSSDTASVKGSLTNSSLELAYIEGPIGVIRIFETEQSIIKSLYLQWSHLPLIPHFFKINDPLAWNEILLQSPSAGEGVVEFRPGLLELCPVELPNEAYQVDMTINQNLPSKMLQNQKLIISCNVTNKSNFPWPLAGVSNNFFGLSWHVYNSAGTSLTWDNKREYLPPVMFARKKNVVFFKVGERLQSQIYFQAPDEPGEYLIHFDIVHERIKWFSQTNESLPVWSLSVGP